MFTVSTAESCTGGNIAHLITEVPGSSNYFKGSVVSYATEVKINVLGVPAELVEKYGVVSSEVAEAMANGVRRLLDTDYAISTTGVAGPVMPTVSRRAQYGLPFAAAQKSIPLCLNLAAHAQKTSRKHHVRLSNFYRGALM